MAQPVTQTDAPAGEIVKHGSQLVTFNLAGTLVAEDIQWQKGFTSIDFADYTNDSTAGQPGAIKSSAYSATKGVGSMTVQVKNANTAIFPGEFCHIEHVGFDPIRFIVTSVGISYTQNGATKIPITIAEWMSESPLPQIITLDGDFVSATPCSPILFSRPIPDDSGALFFRQKYKQFRPFWTPLPLDTPAPGVPGFYLVGETELEDTKVADVVTWDREWATVPGERNEPIDATKVYQIARYRYNISPFAILEAAVSSYSEVIRATKNIRHYRTGASLPAVGRVPFIQGFSFSDRAEIFDFGSGFPTVTQDGHTFFNQNVGVNTIISQHIEPYLGRMVRLITVSGT